MVIRMLGRLLAAPVLHLVVELAGLAVLVVAAFAFHLVAGLIALGVALLIVAALLEAFTTRSPRTEQ